MDFIIKLTIGLFIFCIFVLFFKSTKQMSKNYLNGHMKETVDFDEIMSRNYEPTKIEQQSQQSHDIPLQHLNVMNPEDIVWVVNE